MTVSRSWDFSKFSVSLQFFWSICVRVGLSVRITDPAASGIMHLTSAAVLCCGFCTAHPVQLSTGGQGWS